MPVREPRRQIRYPGGDCNDSTASVAPGVGGRNGIDDDCDGETDEVGAEGCTIYYADEDEDGYGEVNGPICACAQGDLATNDEDCDDTTGEVSPDIEEVCNGIDDDCDGLTDEENALGCTVRFFDQDGDGFGLGDTYKCLCENEWPYAALDAGDCNDDDAEIKPFAQELCDGIDNDCDEETDEENLLTCVVWWTMEWRPVWTVHAKSLNALVAFTISTLSLRMAVIWRTPWKYRVPPVRMRLTRVPSEMVA